MQQNRLCDKYFERFSLYYCSVHSYVSGQSMSLMLSVTTELEVEYMMVKRGTVQFSFIMFCSCHSCLQGDITVLDKERWPEIIILFTTAISIYIMQLASVQRYWSMSEVPQQIPSFVTRRCTNILVTTGVVSSISVSVSIKLVVLFSCAKLCDS